MMILCEFLVIHVNNMYHVRWKMKMYKIEKIEQKLTRNNARILIFLHVGFFAAVSEWMICVFSDSVVKLHLKQK